MLKRTIIVKTDIGNKSFIMTSSVILIIPFYRQKFTQDIYTLLRACLVYQNVYKQKNPLIGGAIDKVTKDAYS